MWEKECMQVLTWTYWASFPLGAPSIPKLPRKTLFRRFFENPATYPAKRRTWNYECKTDSNSLIKANQNLIKCKSYKHWTGNPFLLIKLRQHQQKTSNLFLDATCEFTIPIAILDWYSFSNHSGFQYEQMKYSMVFLIK